MNIECETRLTLFIYLFIFINPENIGYHVITRWLASGETDPSGAIRVQSVSLATFGF